ncbi:hypothetical protein PoB_001977600 [Plakobranchus ocellatus]|uniref:CCHC-type domain-containing protein n=1 Tax=Plakobranchus ocellatus TaxID=259542 RepID=A0AAV3ZBG9_9GAST|nr:hypothetical protein PoB_001977600 [Plakobranchus ocellatus]
MENVQINRYDLTKDEYRRRFRICKPMEGVSAEMFMIYTSYARPVKDSVQPREPDKRVGGWRRAGELKARTNNQQSNLKCKRYGHIARDCTHSSPSPREESRCRSDSDGSTSRQVLFQSEINDERLRLMNGKAVLVVMNHAALGDPKEDTGSPSVYPERRHRRSRSRRDEGHQMRS